MTNQPDPLAPLSSSLSPLPSSPLLLGLLFLAALLGGGCALEDGAEGEAELSETSSALLSGEQVYEIANVYNSGGANGFAVSFAGGHDFSNMNVAFNYQAQFWPGGPQATGAYGAAITYDGQPLPSFWSTGVTSLPWNGTAYSTAVNNMNALTAILINRTPYAAYFSLGSLVASAATQANASRTTWPESQRAWNLAISLLTDATTLANALCRPSTSVWKTAFNVQEMRDLLRTAPPGPNYVNWTAWGNTWNVSEYLRARLATIQANLGAVIANPSTLESGVHGQGCIN